MNKIQPKMECPLRKVQRIIVERCIVGSIIIIMFQGIYQVTNGTFDGNAFANLPIEDWYWKIVSKTKEDGTNRVLICIQLEAQIVPI